MSFSSSTHVTYSLPLCAPAPPASICGFLDHLPSVFIFNPNSLTLHSLKIYRKKQSFLVVCLLLLAGDVEINPGPVQSILPTINLASFNIRSASSITDIHNKPEILKHLIHDHKIDAFCLTETWLHPDTLPATINSLLLSFLRLSHSPTAPVLKAEVVV